MNFDTIIYNGTVLTLNAGFEVIPDGMICIRDGRIVEAGPAPETLPSASETIDACGGLILPGLVNTHTHLPMTLFRGLADDLPLDRWLNEYMFPAEAAHVRPENVKWGTLLGCAEMLLAGITTCCDGYFHESAVASAVQTAGMRAVLGHGILDFPAPGVPDPSRNVETALEFARQWQDVSPLIRPSLFCHSPYTCSAETLRKAKKAADAAGVLFQIHVAEARTEREQFEAEYGSPVKYLDQLGILNENTLMAHCVWLDAEDTEIVAARGAKISHNPESNMKLASGIAPVPDFLKAGITVGLGTDGCASNNSLDLFGEMDMAAKLHKAATLDPTVMDAETVLRMATINGAKALGLGHVTGSLEPGKAADIIVMDMNRPHLTPLYHPESHMVYAASASDVRHVMVAGRIVVRDRQLLTMDISEILEQVRRISRDVRAAG